MAKQNLAKKRKNNVVRYSRKQNEKHFNVGYFLLFIIFVYILGHTVLFISREKTSIYRVVSDEKTEVINTTGLALRKEKVFKSTEAGYINYYVNGNSRVHKGEVVFSIDKTGSIYSKLIADDQTDESGERLTSILHQFQINRDDHFVNTYSLKDSMNETVMTTSGKMVMATINKTADASEYLKLNNADDSGIVVYGADGLEDMTEEKVTQDIFEKQNSYILKTAAENEGKVEAGEAVYKLISDEVWSVVLRKNLSKRKLM